MMKKIIVLCIISMFLLTSFAGLSTVGMKVAEVGTLGDPKTIYVDNDGGQDYASIQEAIDAASPGDTINIPSGTYFENIVIDKSIKLIGENNETTIIDGSRSSNVIYVTAGNVEISGFTIQNSGKGDWDAGLQLVSDYNTVYNNIFTSNENGILVGSFERTSKGNTISNNDIFDNGIGILFYNSKDNAVIDNTVTSSSWIGIRVAYSTGIKIIDNDIFENDEEGISFWDAHSNTVEDNTISNNGHSGIFSWTHSSKGIFRNNDIISNSQDGIFIDQVYENGNFEITGNRIESNGRNGIRIQFSRFNNVFKNEIIQNKYGIYLLGADRNDILGNNFTKNTAYGVVIYSDYECSYYNNFYYNNFRENKCNAKDECSNKWFKDKGNYWDDYDGDDDNSDGIGDAPYDIVGGSNQDKFPLMEPYHGKSKSKSAQPALNNILVNFLENHLHLFPILTRLLQLLKL